GWFRLLGFSVATPAGDALPVFGPVAIRPHSVGIYPASHGFCKASYPDSSSRSATACSVSLENPNGCAKRKFDPIGINGTITVVVAADGAVENGSPENPQQGPKLLGLGLVARLQQVHRYFHSRERQFGASEITRSLQAPTSTGISLE